LISKPIWLWQGRFLKRMFLNFLEIEDIRYSNCWTVPSSNYACALLFSFSCIFLQQSSFQISCLEQWGQLSIHLRVISLNIDWCFSNLGLKLCREGLLTGMNYSIVFVLKLKCFFWEPTWIQISTHRRSNHLASTQYPQLLKHSHSHPSKIMNNRV